MKKYTLTIQAPWRRVIPAARLQIMTVRGTEDGPEVPEQVFDHPAGHVFTFRKKKDRDNFAKVVPVPCTIGQVL